tara:strand:- start:28 stop:3396 length:3369 start_codon:yes stop_codon:yes gene_type:complete
MHGQLVAVPTYLMLFAVIASTVVSAANCTSQTNVIIGTNQMGAITTQQDSAACCAHCSSTAGCNCWTFKTADDPKTSERLQCILKNASQCTGSSQRAFRVSGMLDGPPSPPGSVVVVPPAAPVPVNGIAEWTLTIEGIDALAATENTSSPWEALNITLDLRPPPGGAPYNATHRGFSYAGGAVWKVRAALRFPGQYSYTLTVATMGNGTMLHRSQGAAACSTAAAAQNTSVGPRGFLRPRFGKPPYRTQYEDGTLFTGLGLGDCLNDELSFLTYNETDGTAYNRSLEEYVTDYGDAGFNIFRWSNGNCAWRIEESFDGNPGRRVGNIYNATYVRELDRVFDTFREHGMSMWAVPFPKDSRNPLFPNMGNDATVYHLAQREAIERHLQYVVARWGAQTDVWSLLNEQRATDAWLSVAAGFLRSVDPYDHPITSSWNDHLNMSQIEMDSVHWYYGAKWDDTKKSARAAAEMIDTELANGKPVYFTESGNQAHNWDPNSHTRMRIRSWVAVFKSAALLWWNTAGTRTCVPCGGGNMYLGPTERSYNLILRRFADHMTDPAVEPLEVSATLPGVNAFGLQGVASNGSGTTRVIMVYLHHNASHSVNISAGVDFGAGTNLTNNCAGEWLSPSDGSTSPIQGMVTGKVPLSPPFSIDAALRLVCPLGPPVPPVPPPPSPTPQPSPGIVGGTRYKHWGTVQGANYVPSYATNDVKDIFRPGFWNATVVDRELGFAKKLAINSLRVFVGHGGYVSDNRTTFLQNYRSFQRLAKAHGLTLLVTLGTGERAAIGQCNETTEFVNTIVGAEEPGVVIAYEADNEPTGYMIGYLINCTLPALNNASRSVDVDISVGLAHVGEVDAVKDYVTTLNWHSYNGQSNGGGLYGEINELQKYVNKFSPPKQLVLTEYLARPAQPLTSAYPVLRDNSVAGYAWALIIVDCTSHWNRPVNPGDPPFQGMLWPNGSVYDDLEEGECMRTKCGTMKYVHHCCNYDGRAAADGAMMLDNLFNFSGVSNSSDWQSKVFGTPVFKLPGPREGSMRWTSTAGASVLIGPLPSGTRQIALYLPTSPSGAAFTVQLDGVQIHAGSTEANTKVWVARTVLPVQSGKLLKVTVGSTSTTTQFSIVGATLFT